MNTVNNLEKALLNLISDPYDKDNCFYGHVIAQCEIHIDEKFNGIAGVGFWDDVFHLYVNPLKFKLYSLKEQKAILIHEAMHIIFNHISRKEERDHLRWNIATDAAINQFIEHLPKGCIYPETLRKNKDKFAEYYYEFIDSKYCKFNNKDSTKTCTESTSNVNVQQKLFTLDSHELWEKSENELTEDYSNDISQSVIDKAIEKNRGSIPYSVSLAIKLLNTPSQISWQKILKRIMGNSKKYYEPSYKKVNRRFPDRIELPGKQSKNMPTLVCIIDVSGSMSNREISNGLIEIQKICQVTNHKLVTIQVDTEVQNISKVDFKNHNFTRKGCGGTELYPAVEYIYENKIENNILVFISDGYFGFEEWNKIPKVPMFFLITSDEKINLPSKRSYQFLLKNK